MNYNSIHKILIKLVEIFHMPNLSEIDLGSALLSTFILVGFIATAFAFIKLTIIGINYVKVNYLKQKEEDKDEKKLKGF